jgi:hypothetical protein
MASYASRWSSAYDLGQLSRFVSPDVQALMERVTPAADGDGAEAADAEPEPAGGLDLRALLRGRFGG